MARLEFDIATDNEVNRFPAHGWAENSQGTRLLWLPIMRLVEESNAIRRGRGETTNLTISQITEIKAFHGVVEKLFLSLRELHRTTAFIASCDGLEGVRRDIYGVRETIPLYVDLVYTYLRRLADHFTRAIRYSVFQHFDSAPRELKQLLKKTPDELSSLNPFIDTGELFEAIKSNSSWFSILRSDDTRKGLRDSLEHHATKIDVQSSKVGDEPWRVEAYLVSGTTHTELIKPIPEMISEICCMFEGVCRAIGWSNEYKFWSAPYGDCLVTTGEDEDWTGYWPQLCTG